MTVCGQIPEVAEVIADTPITPASPGEARRDAIGGWSGLASMSVAEHCAMEGRGRNWVYHYHGMTALAGRLLDALRDRP